jgi:hypothetical protein
MTTRNLPAQRTRPAVPVAAPPQNGKLIPGEVVHSTTEGFIGLVEFMHLPGDRLMLNGPVRQVRTIIRWHRERGLLLRANDPRPSDRGTMVTITFTPLSVPGRVRVGRAPQVKPWTRRRKVAVFGVALPAVFLACVVLVLVWPLVGMAVAVVLLVAAYLSKEYQRRHCNPLQHVAIDHSHSGGASL